MSDGEGMRGQYPKAYLRIDPNIDSTHPDPGAFVRLLCAANRQPRRGVFKTRELVEGLLGRRAVANALRRRDLVELEGGGLEVDGWDLWQEGDISVGERMRRYRDRQRAAGERPASRTANWRLRTQVFERDWFTCRYCGIADYPRDFLVAEHVLPSDRGGEATLLNLVTACRPCNHRKGGRTPEEAGMVLRPVPAVTPETRHGDASQRNATSARARAGGGGVGVGVGVGDDTESTNGGAGGAGGRVPTAARPPAASGAASHPNGGAGLTEYGIRYDPADALQVRVLERCVHLARLVAQREPTNDEVLDMLRAVSSTPQGVALDSLSGAGTVWLEQTIRACDAFEQDHTEEPEP